MALPILDGNQSATTLSTIIDGGAHIPAHTVVSLGSQAISDITSGVSGSVVSISNFPTTQTIAGTVTANPPQAESWAGVYDNGNDCIKVELANLNGDTPSPSNPLPIAGTVTANLFGEAVGGGPSEPTKLQCDSNGFLITSLYRSGSDAVNYDPVAGNVSVNVKNVSSVTIGSLPAISGTVTVGASSVTFNSNVAKRSDGSWQPLSVETGSGYVSARVYPSDIAPFLATVTVGNSVTIGSLPAISGTVTVSSQKFANRVRSIYDGSTAWSPLQYGVYELFFNSAVTASLNNIFGSNPSWVVPYSDSVTVYADDGTSNSFYSDGTQWTLDDFATPAGNTVITGSQIITNLSADATASVFNGYTIVQKNVPIVKNDRLYVSSTGTATVTVGAVPSGSLTTRFGSVVTANTAFATSAVTNNSRKYLLIQNVTTASNAITVGVGFTPTTTMGIQLTAGAGITFESSFIPTGAVYVLSSVTASNFTILEA